MKYFMCCALLAAVTSGCASSGAKSCSKAHHPDRTPDGDIAIHHPFDVTLRPNDLDADGTLSFWFRLDEPMTGKTVVKKKIIDSEVLELFLDARGTEVFVLWHIIGPMNGQRDNGKKNLYWLAANLTHLNAKQWYHVAATWDGNQAERNGVFIDGVRQVAGAPIQYPGQIQPVQRDYTIHCGAEGVSLGAVTVEARPVTDAVLWQRRQQWKDFKGYTTEGYQHQRQSADLSDVDWDQPVYSTDFDDPAERDKWQLEGGHAARIADGDLILENAAPGEKGSHLVCWLKQELPADYLLEFSFRPKDRRNGLGIVFLNARGVNGESVFDPALQPRDGTFRQYTSGDINNYHISYWAGGRGCANVRKNSGFQLVGVGKDLVYEAPNDAMQKIQIHKKGETVTLLVDGEVAVIFDDDEQQYGHVHNHKGWIALRQMGHTEWGRYGYLRVYPLK